MAAHYNGIAPLAREKRSSSSIIGIREANNFIKAKLIEKYAVKGGAVLDLGCGNGGDLLKLSRQKVRNYYGCDIAEESLNEALKRSSGLSLKANFLKCSFATQRIRLERKVDLCMAQFSLHYAFRSQRALRMAITNACENLKDDGVFLLTIPNDRTIRRRSGRQPNGIFGNAHYKIEPLCSFSETPAYNQPYKFYLQEALTGCTEYLAPVELLREVSGKLGMQISMCADFLQILNVESQADPELFRRMVKTELKKEHVEVIELYRAVVLKKRGLQKRPESKDS